MVGQRLRAERRVRRAADVRRRPRPRPCSGTRECRGRGRRASSRTANACGRSRRPRRARGRCRDGSAIRTTARGAARFAGYRHRDDVLGFVSAYGRPLGVTRKPSSRDAGALTLPDLPRLMPAAFIASAVAITCSAARVRRHAADHACALGEHRREPLRRCARHAALGDEPGDQPRRRHVERVVDRLACRAGRSRRAWSARSRRGPATLSTSSGSRASIGIASPDGSAPVDRRRRQRDVERHVVVARGERLVVGADLVAHVAVARDAIGADEHDVDVAAAASAGRSRCRRTACAECRAAPAPMRSGSRPASAAASRCTQTCSGSPSACARNSGAVAVPQPQVASAPALQWVMTLTGPGLALRDAAQQRDAVLADRVIDRRRPRRRSHRPRATRRRRALRARSGDTCARTRSSAQRRLTAVGRVASSAACACASASSDGVAIERHREPVGADRADQRRAAHPHLANRAARRRRRRRSVMRTTRAAARAGRARRCGAPRRATSARYGAGSACGTRPSRCHDDSTTSGPAPGC